MDEPIKLQHVAKGERPQFCENKEADRLFAIVMALASEVSVLRERLDSVEAVGADSGLWASDAVETYTPTAERAAEREKWRDGFIDRILYIMKTEAESCGKQS